jgi:hypothetical protein
MVRSFILPALIVLALAAPAVGDPFQQGFPGSQWAPPEGRGERDQDRDRPAREVPLSSILRDLRSQYGGQHLDAQKIGDRYRISWITDDGRRLNIEVDAATGRTLSVRG